MRRLLLLAVAVAAVSAVAVPALLSGPDVAQAQGCASDMDCDGTPDSSDQCPSTPGGLNGCPAQTQTSTPPPAARTDFPTNVTNEGATLNGIIGSSGAAATYHFEYGVTSALGSSTPEKPAPNGQNVSERVGLPGNSKFFFRIVGTNAGGKKNGDTIEWTTPGPPAAGRGTKRTTDTVGPGGSIGTGSDPSKSNPIVVKAISEKGGTLWIDEISNPDRPGEAGNCDGGPDAGCEEFNPEDDAPTDRHWYGPAIQVWSSRGSGRLTVVYTIHGGADLVDPRERVRTLDKNPARAKCGASGSKVKHLANGDTRITLPLQYCEGDNVAPPVANFYNPSWHVRLGESFGAFSNDLKGAVGAGYINFGLHCVLKCTRTLSASIAAKSAKKLGLKSGNLGTVKTSFGEEWNYRYPLSTKVRRAFRRITRNGGQITINFRAKAVGPNDQVFKKRTSIKMKAESEADTF